MYPGRAGPLAVSASCRELDGTLQCCVGELAGAAVASTRETRRVSVAFVTAERLWKLYRMWNTEQDIQFYAFLAKLSVTPIANAHLLRDTKVRQWH